MRILRCLPALMRAFLKANGANVAMMFGLALFPIAMATGAGIDFARAVMVHQSMNNALDAAALAVGNASPNANCASDGSNNATTGNGAPGSPTTCASYQQTAQQYFDQNYDHSMDATYGSPGNVAIAVTSNANGQSVQITSTLPLRLTLLGLAPLFGGHAITSNVTASSTVVWGQTKLWVSLVLDNTGSMCQTDSNPGPSSCSGYPTGSKLAALKNATSSLLDTLKGAASKDGDVQVALIPFVKDVNIGSYSSASWIDYSDWDQQHGTCDISGKSSYSSCLNARQTWSWTGGTCNISADTSQNQCTRDNGTWTAASCNISGLSQSQCTGNGVWNKNKKTCSFSAYKNQTACEAAKAVWTAASCNIPDPSLNTQNKCTNATGTWTWTTGNCSVSAYTTQATCQAAPGNWTPSPHSGWGGCVNDRGTDNGPPSSTSTGSSYYDVWNTAPIVGQTQTMFEAEDYNPYCSTLQPVMPLSYQWTALKTEVGKLSAAGGTNQPIGLVWGWHALSQGDPLNPIPLPTNTSRYIIILSDGLNTQDRWWGDGVNHSQQVDDRMTQVCTNAKADNVIIYAVYVDIGGAQGNSKALQDCASDTSKYFDLTSTSQIATAFNQIGQQITNLRVSQ